MKNFLLTFLLFSSLISKGQIVQYTVSENSGCAPFIVSFSNTTPNTDSCSFTFTYSTTSQSSTYNYCDVSWVFNLAGTYDVTLLVKDTFGNIYDSTFVSAITVYDCSGIDEINSQLISIYPNPTKDVLHVKVNDDDLNSYTFSLVSLTGVKVNLYQKFIKKNKEVEINVEAVAKGIYIMEIQNATSKISKKIIID